MKVSELIAELSKLDGNTELRLAMPFDEDEVDVYEIGAIDVIEDDQGDSAVLLIAELEFEDEGFEEEPGNDD